MDSKKGKEDGGFDFSKKARQTWSSQKTHKKILAQIISASLRMSESTTRWSLAQGSRGSVAPQRTGLPPPLPSGAGCRTA